MSDTCDIIHVNFGNGSQNKGATPIEGQRNMAKRAKKGTVIKLEVKGDGVYGRDTWYSIGPFKAKLNDDKTMTLGLPDTDPQILTPASNEYGTYYVGEYCGGKVFVNEVDHEQYGKYARIKLGDKVVLPEAVREKIAYKPKQGGGSRGSDNKNYWS